MDKNINIILGGVTVEALFRDGTKEEVKVRQLPIESIDRWVLLQGDEVALVELYCDREDKVRAANLESANALGARLNVMLGSAEIDNLSKISAELEKVRERIIQINDAPRWASKLLPESHEQILGIGGELNRPIFARWSKDRRAALAMITGLTKEITNELNSAPSPLPVA